MDAEIRLYDRLFLNANPDDVPEGENFKDNLNPDSLKIMKHCKLEPGLARAMIGTPYQFLRNGYFCLDSKYSTNDKLVFNLTVPLRDTWAKIENAQKTDSND